MKYWSIMIFTLFLSACLCNDNEIIECYSVKKIRFHPKEELLNEYCDTIRNGVRYYSAISKNFFSLNKIDALLRQSAAIEIGDTIYYKDVNNNIILNDIQNLDNTIYYRFVISENPIIYHSVHTKDLGVILVKFDYKTYLLLDNVIKGNAKNKKKNDVKNAIEILSDFGGWDF